MGEFTIYDVSQIDDYIKKKLKIIVDDILQEFGETSIYAIILSGSFGRGEGGVVVNKRNIRLVNDFDINIFVKPFKYFEIILERSKSIEYLSSSLANKVNIKQIDLSIRHPIRYFFIKAHNIETYEYLYGHKVLYGKSKNKIKTHENINIPLDDGTKFFLTRGSGLLIAAIYFFKKNKIDFKDRENFLIETNKAILAMGDSFLIMKHKYHYSYKKRQEIIKNIDFSDAPHGEEIKNLYCNALKWKLMPNFKWAGDKKEIQKWFYLKQLFSEFFIWFESQRLNRKFFNWSDYVNSIYSLQKDFGTNLAKKIYNLLNLKTTRKDFSAKLSILPALLFSLETEKSIHQELLGYGVKNLYNYYGIKSESYDWKKSVLSYLNIFHPSGIVKKILEEN